MPDKTKKIKFALLGASNISSQHLLAFNNLQDKCELIDVCDIDTEALKKISNSTKANLHTSFKEMLSVSKADCIVVTTPNGLHAEHSIMAAEAGFHVVTEKPIAININDAKTMVNKFKLSNKLLFVVKQLRFMKSAKLVKRALLDKRFGKIFFIGANVFWTRPQEYYDSAKWRGTFAMDGGGALMNQAIHYLDLLQWFGGEIIEIKSFNKTLFRNIEAEDTSVNSLAFSNGALGSCNVTMLTYPNNLETSITILGEKGSVKIGGKNLNYIDTWLFEDKKEYDPELKEIFEQESFHTTFYRNVINSLIHEESPEVDGNEAIKSLKLVLKSYESAVNNK